MPSSSDPGVRPRATVLGAFLEGWRRVLRAPSVTLSVLGMTFLLALPLAIALGGMLEEHLGASAEAERAGWGWHAGWAAEFGAQAQGLGRTFTHEVIGFGSTVSIVSDFADREPLNPTVAGAAAAYGLLWIFLSGGILDRFARGRPIRTAAFFSACGVYFVRFLRLAVVVGAVYWALFTYLHPQLFLELWTTLTRDSTSEVHGILTRVGLYIVFFGLVALVSLIADYAKVRAVVEDRRSMLGALGASIRFIRRRAWRATGLYLLNVLAFVVILRLWYQVAPGGGVSIWLALLITQIYLLCRIWAKLAFMASEVAFFQGELAHASYTATPLLEWPESPAAEAIVNLVKRTSRSDPDSP